MHDPENARLFLGLALAYMHLRSYSEADVMARRALELDPDSTAAKKIAGYIEKKQESPDQAPRGMDVKPGAGALSNPHAANPHGPATKAPAGAVNPHQKENPKTD